MEYDHLRKLLASFGDETASRELTGLIAEFQSTEHWNLVRAVIDHMISQNLRAANGGLEGFGRVQGMNGVLDYFEFLRSYKPLSPESPVSENPHTPRLPVQGSYGVV